MPKLDNPTISVKKERQKIPNFEGILFTNPSLNLATNVSANIGF